MLLTLTTVTFFLALDPIDCSDCHLTWLIRDNRHFLEFIYEGQCSNGTYLTDLDPNGFSDCPVRTTFINSCLLFSILLVFLLSNLFCMRMMSQSFTCPLGYDGYYADLTNCSNYYVCTNNIADLNVNSPVQLIF